MANIDEIRKMRLKKLKAIERAGFLAYPGEIKRTHSCKEATDKFKELSKSLKEIVLAGRIMSQRQHGGLVFCHIFDGTAEIQILFKKDRLGEKNSNFFLGNSVVGGF